MNPRGPTLKILRTFEEDVGKDNSLGRFVLLDRASFKLPGTKVTILGCSLFSRVAREQEMAVSIDLNDFYQTSDWDVPMHTAAHERDLAWLNTQVKDLEHTDRNVWIFSHWSPSRDPRAIDPRHAKSPITPAFSTDLSKEPCFGSEKVKLWAFGHKHYNCDFTVERDDGAGPLRLMANQRGYYFAQAHGYDGEKVVEA